jgi:hypothetical protein
MRKHASWVKPHPSAVLPKTVELEFSARSKRCLDRHVAKWAVLEVEALAWVMPSGVEMKLTMH